jgi:hypothetical protein
MVLDNALFRLRVSRREAARELQAQIKIGQAIRGQRIREMRDLEEARREKQEWTSRCLETLENLVNGPAWAEQFNEYAPTILPEYAEFDMFVEVFDEEMKQRLGKLQGILKSLPSVPEPQPLQPDAAQPQRHPEMIIKLPPEQPMAAQASATSTVTNPILTNPLAEPDPPRQMPSQVVHAALILRANDDVLRQSIAQFMQKMGITLHVIDRQSVAQPMIEQLAAHKNLNFAMLLVDSASGAGSPEDMFDLGCCVGRLGAGRVYSLHRGGECTVDRQGISHVPVDNSEGWQLVLARQLKKAGVQVDLNKLV